MYAKLEWKALVEAAVRGQSHIAAFLLSLLFRGLFLAGSSATRPVGGMPTTHIHSMWNMFVVSPQPRLPSAWRASQRLSSPQCSRMKPSSARSTTCFSRRAPAEQTSAAGRSARALLTLPPPRRAANETTSWKTNGEDVGNAVALARCAQVHVEEGTLTCPESGRKFNVKCAPPPAGPPPSQPKIAATQKPPLRIPFFPISGNSRRPEPWLRFEPRSKGIPNMLLDEDLVPEDAE